MFLLRMLKSLLESSEDKFSITDDGERWVKSIREKNYDRGFIFPQTKIEFERWIKDTVKMEGGWRAWDRQFESVPTILRDAEREQLKNEGEVVASYNDWDCGEWREIIFFQDTFYLVAGYYVDSAAGAPLNWSPPYPWSVWMGGSHTSFITKSTDQFSTKELRAIAKFQQECKQK